GLILSFWRWGKAYKRETKGIHGERRLLPSKSDAAAQTNGNVPRQAQSREAVAFRPALSKL
ncbi:hypothetical protein M514_27397, partial [Trichuris suis]